MIVQAIGLLDELDKEINTYAMRVKEWFGWHFPEMAKVGERTARGDRLMLLASLPAGSVLMCWTWQKVEMAVVLFSISTGILTGVGVCVFGLVCWP